MGQGAPLLAPSPFQRLEQLLTTVSPAGKPIVPLHLGEPDGGLPPLARPLLQGDDIWQDLGRYPPVLGSDDYRQAVKDWAIRRFHLSESFLSITPPNNNILPTSGSREGLALAITYAMRKKQQRLGKDQRPLLVITHPFYHVYHASALLALGDVVAIHCFDEENQDSQGRSKKLSLSDGIDGLTMDEKNRLAAVVVCTPDNPTGRCLTLTEMEHLFDRTRRHEALLISDECYSDLDHGVPPISFLNHANNGFGLERIIISNSLSKRSGAPGLRVGLLISDPAIITELATWRAHLSAIPSRALLTIATALWNDDRHVALNRQKYQQRLAIAADILGDSPSFQSPEAGFFLWLRFHNGITACRDIFAATGIKLLPGVFMGGGADDGPALPYGRLAMILPEQPNDSQQPSWRQLCAQLKPFLLP